MNYRDFIGNESAKGYLDGLLAHDRVGHAYIFTGEKGLGKRTLAGQFARALLCTGEGERPCGACHGCRMALSGNHPDLIWVTHEKPNLITVDEVRDQIVGQVSVKPYYNGKKVFIVPDAGLMNLRGQNAILKTIEEPPAYAVILLLSENRDMLLPTIVSRCVTVSLKPLHRKQVEEYLTARRQVPSGQAAVLSALSHGNIGRAIRMLEDEEYRACSDMTMQFLRDPMNMAIDEVFAFAKEAAKKKEQIPDMLDIMLFWYRDVLMAKTAGKEASLTFIEETEYIVTRAKRLDYADIGRALKEIGYTKERLSANVSAETGMDVLLLAMRA